MFVKLKGVQVLPKIVTKISGVDISVLLARACNEFYGLFITRL